ncbi:MAG: sensor histidine kinase [Thermoleophilia bacterium]
MRRLSSRIAKTSLGEKVAGLLALTIALTGIILSGVGTQRLYGLLIEQKLDSSEQITSMLASSALPDILTNDFVSLQDSTDQVLAYDSREEIVFVVIYDTNGAPLVHSSRLGSAQAPEETREIRKISAPMAINDRSFGRIDMFISLNQIEGTVLRTVISLVLILAIVVVVSSVGMTWVAYRVVVVPVQKLAVSARQISKGNLDLKIPVNSYDELGELSYNFNHMAESLKKRQEELQIAYKKLERNYQAIREAYRQLRDLDRMKSNFIAIVSHELRTPLSLIKGYVETMATGNLGKVTALQQEKLEVVVDSVDRLADIVDKSLDFSVIEQGKMAIEKQKLQLSEIIGQVMDEFALEISGRKLSLEQQIPRELPLMLGDKVRLHQVIHNLVANAVEFTPEKGTVGIYAGFDSEKKLNVVTITDTGPGIPDEDLTHLFSPFYQVESPMIRKHPGVGLGLAIAKGIVEQHEGNIDVVSAVGKGSTFKLSFPVLDGEFAQK